MAEPQERRKDRRLSLNLPVEFTLAQAHGAAVIRPGLTHNVSSGGVYFETNMAKALAADSTISIKLAIPQRDENSSSMLSLLGNAVVRRVDALADDPGEAVRCGIAAQFSKKPNVQVWPFDGLFIDPP